MHTATRIVSRVVPALAVAATVVLSGCGGSGSRAIPQSVRAPVQVALTLPHSSPSALRRATFIAPSVRSGAFSANGGPPVIAQLVAGAPGCTTTAAGLTCTVMMGAPVGMDTFTVALYDGPSATGSLLGTGSASATLVSGQTTSVGITVGGVVASVILGLGTTTPVAGTPVSIPLTVTALDADGNIIVADPFATPITLTDSDNSGATQLSTSTLSAPTQTVSLSYSGATLLNADLSATVAGSTPVVTGVVLTPKTASTTDWATFGYNAQRTGYNPTETVCCTTAPARIWSRKLISTSKYLTGEPIFAANMWVSSIAGGGAYVDLVFVADNHADLYALDAATGATVWSKTLGTQTTGCTDMPDKVFGITGTPLFDRASDRLYVVDGAGLLWALDPASGAVASGWPSAGLKVVTNAMLDHVYGALNLDTVHGIMPVPTASYCDDGDWNGSLRFVNVNTASVVSTFDFANPTNQSRPPEWGSGMWGMGGTSLDPATGDIFGASGNAEPNEIWPYSDSVVRWTTGTFAPAATFEASNNIGDDDFGAIPSLFPSPDGMLCGGVEGKSGILYMFNSAAIASGPTSQPQLGLASSNDYNSATPSYSPVTGKLYITTGDAGSPSFPPGLYAYTVDSGCQIASTPDWHDAIGGTNILSPTTIANGAVFVGIGDNVYAFRADTGAQLWFLPAGTQSVYAGITVVDGMVFTADWDGTISAFAAPGANGQSRSRTAGIATRS
jgi:hypothetical protein